ncbi:helix-turn-helix transcriptional regulator [Bosea sp. PAMC 26642]|uniref:helix-turn-helix transcriptional regulator n=1 Tax=Bosea sp. (strain PAMC 26642) TaxID=1792307 RepID=UPI00077016D7|nr:helix-turn-helix domain-containing protein [Bosea sp. PAMC 26642]AMJ60971.1 hypothetical protein AXW83_12275 [Bosea sp. PAMC 26642]
MNPDDLLSPEDAGLYLNKSAKTLERWRSLGSGPAFHRIGNTVVYRRSDLDAYFLAARVEPAMTGRVERVVRSA